MAAPAPTVVAVGAILDSTTTLAPAFPTGWQPGDVILTLIETQDEAVAAPSGWAHVSGSPVSMPTTNPTRLNLFWRRMVAGDTAPTYADPGDHIIGRTIAIRGVPGSGDPWDVVQASTEATADTTGSITGLTTTVDRCLIVTAVTTGLDLANSTAAYTGWTNASLASITEQIDNQRAIGLGGAIGLATGVKLTAGAVSATTVTTPNAQKAMLAVALKPAPLPSTADAYATAVLADSPISYWRLGDHDVVARDSVAENHGTENSPPHVKVAGLPPALADAGGARDLDGSSDGVLVPDSASLDFGDTFTIEGWIQRGTTVTTEDGALWDSGSGGPIVRFDGPGGGGPNRILLRRNGTADCVRSTVGIDDTNTHHIVVTKSGATVKQYIDGIDVTGTVTNQTMANTAIAKGVGIADAGASSALDGTIDEVAVYSTALSAARVLAHYQAGNPPTTPVNGDALDLVWDTQGAVAGDALDLKWDTAAQVASGAHELLWDTRAVVAGSAWDLLWDVRSAADAGALDLVWDVTGVVAATSNLRWDLAGRVEGSASLRWDAAVALAGDQLDLRWDTPIAVALARVLLWDTRADSGSSTVQARWDAVAQVSAVRLLLWDARSALEDAPLVLLWDLGGVVPTFPVDAEQLDLRWDTRALVAPALALRWDTAAAVAATRTLLWHARAVAENTLELTWDAPAQLAAALELRWDAPIAAEADALELSWDAAAEALLELVLEWAMLPDESLSQRALGLRWDTRAELAAAELRLRWIVAVSWAGVIGSADSGSRGNADVGTRGLAGTVTGAAGSADAGSSGRADRGSS